MFSRSLVSNGETALVQLEMTKKFNVFLFNNSRPFLLTGMSCVATRVCKLQLFLIAYWLACWLHSGCPGDQLIWVVSSTEVKVFALDDKIYTVCLCANLGNH